MNPFRIVQPAPNPYDHLTTQEFDRMLQNDEFAVLMKDDPEFAPPGWTHLSFRRLDREPVHDWRAVQEMKNLIVGPEREAIEIYPAESRLVDGANQYHLWVLPAGERIGVGYQERSVVDDGEGERLMPGTNAKQRALR